MTYQVRDRRHHAQPVKRNRKERQSALVFRVEPLCHRGEKIEGLEDCYVEGEIEQWTIVSVPVTTSRRMQEEMKNTLQMRWNKPILIISHNTTFLRAIKLSPNEAAKVIKHGEDYAESYANALSGQTEQESVGGDSDVEGDGSGPGAGEHGGGNSGEESGPDTNLSGAERDPDKESRQKRPAGSPSDSGRFA